MKRLNLPLKLICFIFGIIVLAYLYKPTLTHAALPPEDQSPTPACVSDQGQTKCGDGSSGKDPVNVYRVNCDGSQSFVKTCFKSQDQVCGNGDCQTLTKTETSITPSNPRLEDLTQVTVVGTGNCSQNINFDPGPGLHNPIQFQQPNCNLDPAKSVCRDPSIQDQSYRCTWVYNCIGYKLSSDANNPIDIPTPFSTVFTSSGNASCTSTVQYTVQKPLTCNPENTTPIKDPNGDNSHNLVAKSLNDDKTIAHAINISSLPDNYTQSTFDLIKAPIPGIGVQAGFSALKSLQELVCNNTIAQLTGIKFLYCKVNEDFANQKTKMFEGLTQNIADTTVPSNLQKDPSTNSCYLQDVQDPKTGELTTGNGIFNGIDIATNINYKLNNPDNVQGYDPDPNNYNASIQGTVVSGDQRAPTMNCSEKQYKDFNYPDGYTPPYFDQNAMGCSTTMTTVQPPAGSALACDNKWFLYGNPLGNFGDPNCDFNKDALYSLLLANDTLDHTIQFFFTIIPAETRQYPFDPDTYRSHDLLPHTPDLAGAWGMFQMGVGSKPYPLNIDQGNVPWQQQALNAIHLNHLDNDRFSYWGTSDFYK